MISILLCAVLIFSMPGMTLAGQFDMSQQEQTLDEAAPKESIPAQELSEPTEANKELGEGFGMADESSAPEQAADPTTVDDTDEAASSLPGDAAAAKATSEDEPMQAPEQQPEAQILSIQPLALTNTEITVSGVVPFGLEAAVEAAVLGQGGTVPDDYASITSLTISGQLNDNDFTFIRDNFWGIVTLDLSDTELTSLGVSALNNDQFGQGVFDNLTTLVLPDSMTTIKDGAVYGCKALRNVNLGNIETIERIGFNNCTLLEAVDLSSLKFVGPDAFGNCEDMTLASGFAPVTVGEEAFKNCKSLGEVDLSNVTSLGVSAFDGCASLTLKPGTGFYSGLTSIPEKAFSQCSSLGEVDLSNMTSLGESAFDGCTDLIFKANTVFDPALTSLPAYVFRDCSSLGEVDLSNMTALGESAFDGCTDLTFKANTVFHPALTSLPAYVFRNCSSLGEVDLSNVTALGEYTFYGCTNLTLKNGTGFNPNLTEIPMYAFYQCKSLSSVDVSNIGTFGMHAFHECDNLTFKEGTRFKDGAVLINSAFHSCVSIGEIDVSNVAKIDVLAFYNCYNLTLKPGTGFNPEMTTVSGFSGCTSLGEVDLTNISVVGGSAFANCVNLTLKPGTGTPNLEAIGDAAFWGCTSFPFEKINWNKVKSVGPLAFMDTSIEEADLSNLSLNVNLIQAFLNCTKLYNVKWPESINVYRSINAFRNCALDFSNGYPTGITASNVRDIASNQTPKVFFSIDKTQETLEKGSAFTSPVASAHTLTGTDYAAMLANPANSVWLKSGLSAPVITESITFDDGSGAVGVTSVDTGKVGTYKIKYSIPDTFYADAHERIYTLKVVVPVTGVSLDKTTLAMNAGDRRTLTATVAPPAATNKEVTWRSSNSAVATVGAKGNVTAVGNGTAIITVTTADGGYRATCTVAVTTRVTGVVLGRNNATLDSDDTLQLLAAVSPATASNKAVSWKSSNPKVATVDTNGK
ncbi:MAG: leucine-rich repeat protein, partial [Christensenellaceae bacterium]